MMITFNTCSSLILSCINPESCLFIKGIKKITSLKYLTYLPKTLFISRITRFRIRSGTSLPGQIIRKQEVL